MNRLTLILILIIASPLQAGESILFGQEIYGIVWTNNTADKHISEYLRSGETVKKWSQMLTVNQYPKATKVKDVLSGYMNSVKPMLALKPDIFENKNSSHDDDVLLVLTLLAPNKSHYELVIHRFVSGGGKPVASAFFSYYIPFKEKVDFSFVMKNRNKWIREMFELEIPRI